MALLRRARAYRALHRRSMPDKLMNRKQVSKVKEKHSFSVFPIQWWAR